MLNFFCYLLFILLPTTLFAQPLTGVWHATIQKKGSGVFAKKYNLELKIIANGDSISGTSYYYQSKNNYSRYTIKGLRDPVNNVVKWWDDELIEGKTPQIKLSNANSQAFNINADFSCPNGGDMFLDGSADIYNNSDDPQFNFNAKKVATSVFNDEWDWLINNFTLGANTQYNIDSIGQIVYKQKQDLAILNDEKLEQKRLKELVKQQKQDQKNTTSILKESKMVAIGMPRSTNLNETIKLNVYKEEFEETKIDSSKFVSNPFYKVEIKENPTAKAVLNDRSNVLKKDTLISNKIPIIDSFKVTIPKENQTINTADVPLKIKENQPNTIIKADASFNDSVTKEQKLIKMDSLRSYASSEPLVKIETAILKTKPTLPQVNIPPSSIIAKLEKRATQQVTSIPIYGDTITLKFYDNATIDGDSIAVFLNKILLKEHILLSFDAYEIKIPTNNLLAENELIMVAENLGSVPPNTSTVVIYVNQKRYEVNLESSEQKSASIRFFVPKKQ